MTDEKFKAKYEAEIEDLRARVEYLRKLLGQAQFYVQPKCEFWYRVERELER